MKILVVVVLAVVVVVMVVVVVVAEKVAIEVVAEVEVVIVVVTEVIVVLAAQMICLMRGMVLIDVCRKNYDNPASFVFKPAEIICSRLMLIYEHRIAGK